MGKSKSAVITEGRTVLDDDSLPPTKIVSVRLPRLLVEHLEQVREETGVSLSDLVRPHLEQLALGEDSPQRKAAQTTVKPEQVEEVPKEKESNFWF